MALDTADKRFAALNLASPSRGIHVFPSGTVDAEARLAVLHYGAVLAAAPVEVPDVVGLSQAAGTTVLETDGFTVAVVEAHSASVPAGEIISQEPEAGEFAALGSLVTITVSLGAAPVNTGGHYWPSEKKRKKRRDPLEALIERKREEAEQLREQIEAALRGEPDGVTQETEENATTEANDPDTGAPELPAERSSKLGSGMVPANAEDRRSRIRSEFLQLRSELAKAERAIERYTALEHRRQARATELETFIESTSSRLLDDIEDTLAQEAERLSRILTKH